jgi:CelD/BcsL family acetyltransferase involved in cellulose biosynthesis
LWGFDARFEKLRPGHTLIAYGIRWSIETGRRYFDFMIGGESYKYDYAPEDRGVLSMTVGNDRLRSRATLALSRLRHAARGARPRMRAFGRRA